MQQYSANLRLSLGSLLLTSDSATDEPVITNQYSFNEDGSCWRGRGDSPYVFWVSAEVRRARRRADASLTKRPEGVYEAWDR